MMDRICYLACVLLLSACVAPMTQRVTVSDAASKAEAEKQRELAVGEQVEEQKRLSRIYAGLATNGAELCPKLRPYTGVFSMSKPKSGDMGPVYERVYGIKERQTVLFVNPGSPAESAGVQPKDVIKNVNGISTEKTEDIVAMFEKVEPDAPISAEIEREGKTLTIVVQPQKACRYPARVSPEQVINAFADGKNIMIARGMMSFARDDNELALVVAHELAHNTMAHIDAKKANMGLGLLADIATLLLTRGQTNPGFANAGAGAYSQEFEAEADYVGLYIMAKSGLPIDDAPKFWRRMAAAHPASIKSNHAASHPSTAHRMVALEEAVKEIKEKVAKGEPLVPNMKDGKPKGPAAGSEK